MTDAHTNRDKLIPLWQVCAELAGMGITPPRGGLRWLQTKAASAAFPAHKRNEKWFIYARDLPLVAASYTARGQS